jgi:hypothetical protein
MPEVHAKPSVGRIVHYVSYGTPGGEYPQACRAAVVTETMHFEAGSWEEDRASVVGLCVLNPTGQFFNRSITHDPGTDEAPILGTPYDRMPPKLCDGRYYRGGTWHWPERV